VGERRLGVNTLGIVTGGDEQPGRGVDANTDKIAQRRRGTVDEHVQFRFGALRLIVEQSDAQRDLAQSLSGRTASETVTIALAAAPSPFQTLLERHLLLQFADLGGCTHDNGVELVYRGGAIADRGAVDDLVNPDGLDVPVAGLRGARSTARSSCPKLASQTSSLT
jgi:hypothetical protein